MLTPLNYDNVVSALTGNGELCTTLSPTGFHTPPELATDIAHRTQHFVMAGRRKCGPQHPLINFGTITRSLLVDGKPAPVTTWKQDIDYSLGTVYSEWEYKVLSETTRSCVTLMDNAFLADTVLTNTDEEPHDIRFTVAYQFGEKEAEVYSGLTQDGIALHYSLDDHLGDIQFDAEIVSGEGELNRMPVEAGASATLEARLEPGQSVALSVLLHFSDRMHFEFPLNREHIDEVAERHEQGWRDFWGRSEVVTGNELVDGFRQSALYTLRCQATPWSIPPTLSHPYWGGGTFHDEMYPFFGLLSSNYPELAERIPYFRLTTLPQAKARARGRGALYPWSSTEIGEERDPNGLWLTERFHLGQFAVCIHALWLYERNRFQLDDLYPVLRDLARYFEMNMLERDEQGRLRTKKCVDFDESVGAVTNGPFTICAAIASMEHAANAADELQTDAERAAIWRKLAGGLRLNLPGCSDEELFQIPEGKPLHYSILGPVFPFGIDIDSQRARRSAEHIQEICRSTRGWKPGFSEVFEGSNWMWMAGHLGIVHALQENAELAWEAVRKGPLSAGPFLSPNEHINGSDIIQVPWFTTGCGGWLYALNALFVQVGEEGTRLLPAIPKDLPNARFRDLRAEGGVLVSAEFKEGRLVSLTARAPRPMPWRYRIPSVYGRAEQFQGMLAKEENGWLSLEIEELGTEETSLIIG